MGRRQAGWSDPHGRVVLIGTDEMLDVVKRLFYAVDKLQERSVHADLRDGLMEEELRDFQSEFPFPPLLII